MASEIPNLLTQPWNSRTVAYGGEQKSARVVLGAQRRSQVPSGSGVIVSEIGNSRDRWQVHRKLFLRGRWSTSAWMLLIQLLGTVLG